MKKKKGTEVFLSLGSNIENRRVHIQEAVSLIQYYVSDIRFSSMYETLPLYVHDQPKFLNLVISGMTKLSCPDLLERVLETEAACGRSRDNQREKGPRVIDIDILLYGDLSFHSERLTVPHPGIKERQFVLIPLIELEPDLRDPVTGKKYTEFLKDMDDQGVFYYDALSHQN
ncbi:MAG: 2-amino-4-hydroxy-6-hydroxymethyldihydropteridine diphosphokinase [Spirochaetales bacterium]|nr:2-amino-4-hydroxy-6-hydroxymethyldihydropteridine diphosphokinase [Spirochaetales bacterium]